jgi:hypothetical protein
MDRVSWFSRLGLMLLILAFAVSARAAESIPDDPLVTLRAGHPRLMVLDDQIKTVQGFIRTDAMAADTLRRLRAKADKLVEQPPVAHVLVGPRMLAQSRQALDVISTTAGMYRLTGDVRYAQRAKKEMLAVAGFADWNPSHFLDVAEMTNACGIGYDWIYSQLSPGDRQTIRTAIIEKGLKPGLEAYRKKAFWTDCNMNWGQVCGGGLTCGALAIADEEPALAKQILQLTCKTLAKPMAEFAPDGGWDEGPGYWNYATEYNVFYLAAIDTALGTDFGLSEDSGFSETALFHMHMTGPIGKVFNFADAGDGMEAAPQMFWLARQFNRPEFAAWERFNSAKRMSIFHLLWFDADGQWPPKSELPLAAVFTRTNVGAMRSSWTDRNAWYVGFKGGDNAANHSHLDLGSFVLDAMGQRWAVDLGPDDYNLPGYFGKQRYSYYRLSTRGHNTITVDGANQNTKAKARIISFVNQPGRMAAVIDLSAVYPSGTVQRGICLLDQKRVLVQDQVRLNQLEPIPYEWNLHTPAKVELDGNKATLSLGGVQMRLTLLSPATGKFEMTNTDAPAPQKANPGITTLRVRCNGTEHAPIAVLFSTFDDAAIPAVEDLANWPAK